MSAAAIATGVGDARLAGLRRWNLGLTLVHLAQSALIVFLAGEFAIAVTSSFPEGPPGTPPPAPETLFDVRIGWAVAVFLALAAIDHLLTATVSRGAYERDLRRGINRFRWIEYSFSATLMIILIGFYSGITSINAVIAVAGANVGDDPVRLAPGADEPAGEDLDDDARLLVRGDRGLRPMDLDRCEHRGIRDGPGVRLRHRHRAVHLLLQLRRQSMAAVPGGRQMG